MEEAEPFTPHLMQEMKADKRSMFIVKASSIPHHIFTDDVLKKNGKDLSVVWLLLMIPTPQKDRVPFWFTLLFGGHQVFGAIPCERFRTPANTQMNLRLILGEFKNGDIDQLIQSVNEKAPPLGSGRWHLLPHGEVRKKNGKNRTLDYMNLKKFKRFLEFVEK